jgi:hypothetical protein
MRCIVKFDERVYPPLLSLFIHGAPHRRMHVAMIQQYRDTLRKVRHAAGILTPIDFPIDLCVHFIRPTSPDLDNLLTALYQALDGGALRKPGILTDDGLIQSVKMSKLFVP